jgi:hypothetical protein
MSILGLTSGYQPLLHAFYKSFSPSTHGMSEIANGLLLQALGLRNVFVRRQGRPKSHDAASSRKKESQWLPSLASLASYSIIPSSSPPRPPRSFANIRRVFPRFLEEACCYRTDLWRFLAAPGPYSDFLTLTEHHELPFTDRRHHRRWHEPIPKRFCPGHHH